MPVSEVSHVSSRRHPPVAVLIIALSIGVLGLFRVMQRPQFESYRTLDNLLTGCLGLYKLS